MVKKKNAFFLRSKTTRDCPLSPMLFSIVMQILAGGIKQKQREIKSVQTEKEEAKLFYSHTTLSM